ncbi:MAG: AAA family ATPase [Bacteriovoracia bacterium]
MKSLKNSVQKPMIFASLGLALQAATAIGASANDCVVRHKANFDEVKPAGGGYCVGVMNPNNDRFAEDKDYNYVEGSLIWLSDQSDKRIKRIGNIPMQWLVLDKGVIGVYSSGANYSIRYWNSDTLGTRTCKSDIKVEDVKKGTTKIELGKNFIRVASPSGNEDWYGGADGNCTSKNARAFMNLTSEDRRVLEKYGTSGGTGESNELTNPVVAAKLRMPKGRDGVMKNMIQAMQSQDIRSVLLWGAAGTGKTTIAYGIAKRIAQKDPTLPEWIRDWSIYAIDLSKVNEEGALGVAQKKMTEIIQAAAGKKVILLMDEIHQLLGLGARESGSSDVTDALKTPLANGQICIIGTLTGDVAEKGRFDANSAFQRRFSQMMIDEPSDEVLREIFRDYADEMTKKYNVTYDDLALEEMIKLTRQYGNGQKHPAVGINFLDQLSASKEKNEGEAYAIVVADIKAKVGLMFNVAALKPVDPAKKEKTMGQKAVVFKAEISKQFIGQTSALDVVQRGLTIYAARGAKPGKPPVFLFLGPSGVGKTYLAELTAKYFNMPYKEFKMEGYQQEHSVESLKGSPQGYVGSQEGGALPNWISQNPTSVLNFDEIDKAHPRVLQYLMGLLEQGVVQDGKGNEHTFRGVVFLTSNYLLEVIEEWDRANGIEDNEWKATNGDAKPPSTGIGSYTPEQLKQHLMNLLEKPGENGQDQKIGSFITGRIGLENIVIFNHFNKEQAKQVAMLEVKSVLKKMKEDYKKDVVPDPALVEHIVSNGFSFKYGARPVRGMAVSLIEGPVAEKMIEMEGQEDQIKRLVVGIQGAGRSARGVVRVETE